MRADKLSLLRAVNLVEHVLTKKCTHCKERQITRMGEMKNVMMMDNETYPSAHINKHFTVIILNSDDKTLKF